jgi:hypothetical protein
MVWRLMWQMTMWFTPPRPLNRYQAVAAALAARWRLRPRTLAVAPLGHARRLHAR